MEEMIKMNGMKLMVRGLRPLFVTIALVGIYVFFYLGGDSLPYGDWTTISEYVLIVMPYFIALAVCFSIFAEILKRR